VACPVVTGHVEYLPIIIIFYKITEYQIFSLIILILFQTLINITMKKYLFIFFVLIVGCTAVKEIPKSLETYVWDFSKYTEKGFYFYENCYNGNYKLVAKILIISYAEGIDLYAEGKAQYEGTYLFKKLDWDEILSVIYNKAIEYDANAIINFKIENTSKKYPISETRYKDVPGLVISGDAVIIEDK